MRMADSRPVPLVGVVFRTLLCRQRALLGAADVIIATENATFGMARPAMIDRRGLGSYTPEQVARDIAWAQWRDRCAVKV